MRKRIFRISEDRFDQVKPNIDFSAAEIKQTFFLGEETEGLFSFRSTNDVRIRGVIYSSNPYVVVQNPQFDGIEVAMRYAVVLKEPRESDILTGFFTVIANQFEMSIPFTIRFQSRPLLFMEQEIRGVTELTAIAKNTPQTALKLFHSDGFAELLERQDRELYRLYRGYKKALPSLVNLDEFLIAAGEKTRATFSLDESGRTFYEIGESIKETVQITRDTWGHIEIRVASNAAFVEVEKELLTSDAFLGSTLKINFYVNVEKLHAGINRAVISFDSLTTHKEIPIVASREPEHNANYLPQLHYQKLLSEFTDVYRQFRLHGLKHTEFAERSVELLTEMQKFDDDTQMNGQGILVPKKNVWYLLMKAQALIVSRKEQDALWLIQDLKTDIEDKRSPEWAYLLYLCTLIEPEEDYINKLTAEIEKIFREHQEDVRLFWFLLFLREEYVSDSGRKLKAIAQWIMQGENSPYLYIEAYYLYRQEPYLLTGFTDFSTRILLWAANRGCLTKDIALEIARSLENEKLFSDRIFRLAKKTYEAFPENELFMQILSYLLKTQRFGGEYLHWYQTAIEKEVRLTGLYEAYLLSLPESHATPLPELVTLYFRYQSNLSYQKKAFVYANVVTHRRTSPNIYEQYLRSVEIFAMEQMRLSRMDDNLSILYQIILDIGLINEDVANAMAELLFIQKLTAKVPGIRRVLAYEDYREQPFTLPVDEGVAYVPLLTNEYRVFLEDEEGRLFAEESAYTIEELLHYDAFYEQLKAQATNKLPYIIHDFDRSRDNGLLKKENLEYVESFLDSDVISREYRGSLYPELIRFLQANGRQDMIEKHLLYREPYELLDSRLLTYMIEISIENGLYDKAYELLHRFNGLTVDDMLLQKLITIRTDNEETGSDDFLILFTAYLMGRDLFTESMVSYLNRYYVGPTSMMLRLCRLTDEYHLKAESLYERTLIQMLYTEHLSQNSGQVFTNYLEHNPNKMVIEAYLTYLSRQYILGDEAVPQVIFPELLRYYLRDTKLNESCRIALMKRLSKERELSQPEFEALDSLVNDFVVRNIYFAFYKEMDRRLIIKYHFYDKTFFEYTGAPGKRLKIRYGPEDTEEETCDDMIEMYEGIYVHQFVLFFGDNMNVLVFDADTSEVLKSEVVSYNELSDEGESSRFVRLNRMQSLIVYGEDEQLVSDMREYRELTELTEQLFTVI